ncbi:ABC transporter substrate-binding protein [Bacillus sp. JJ1503]|uniref:ABC transporter substrate-binding protein n=1 Tax=Bacillus sp. JJ1503 TaxID=3122956 RepID=UPI002FFFF3D6
MKARVISALLTFLVLTLLGCSNEANNESKSSNENGRQEKIKDNLQYAINAQPPTIDPHMTTSSTTRDVAIHIFETLVTLNSKFEVVPMLAESWEIGEDGKTYIFHLREGIMFHNGKEMTADDVVASMVRWLEKTKVAPLEGAVFKAKDANTVELSVKEPSLFILPSLTPTIQIPGIMPKEVIEAASESGVEEYIGTGPFKFIDWKQDQYIHLAKFEDYKLVETAPDGLGGKREALVENLYFQIVIDPSTRLAGLQSGQYDVGYAYEPDTVGMLESNPNINVYAPVFGYTNIIFNKNEGMMTNLKMRQAVNAALNMEAIAKNSLVDNYRIYSSIMVKEQDNWYSDAGSEFYNQNDPEKSKKLLAEAGYDGETIRLLTTREFSYMYNSSVVIKEQLEKAGINVEVEVYDWPTTLTRRNDPTKWELFVSGFPTSATPIEQLHYIPGYIDGPEDEKTEELLQQIRSASSQEEASKLWNELQGYSWEYLPIIKIADYTLPSAATDKVTGLTFFSTGPVLWNTQVVE